MISRNQARAGLRPVCAWFNKNAPLHYAALNGHSSVVDVLIRLHADINAVTEVSQCIYVRNKENTL